MKEVPKEFAAILEINTSNPQGLSAITLCVPFKSSSRENVLARARENTSRLALRYASDLQSGLTIRPGGDHKDYLPLSSLTDDDN